MSSERIRNALTGDVDINSAVNGRIRLAPAQQGLKMPYISYEFEGDDPVRDLNGVASLNRQDWVLHIHSESHAVSESIGQKVIQGLSSHTEQFRSLFQSSSMEYDKDNETYRYEIEIKIKY